MASHWYRLPRTVVEVFKIHDVEIRMWLSGVFGSAGLMFEDLKGLFQLIMIL